MICREYRRIKLFTIVYLQPESSDNGIEVVENEDNQSEE